MKKLISILIFFFICLSTQATTYYISESGNDGNSGTSTGAPWKTIAKVNAMFSSFAPGDNVLLNKGDTWRELLIVSASGTSGNPITIGSYGTGAKPRILGSNTATGWTNVGSNVWMATENFTNPGNDVTYPSTIYFTTLNDTTWGHVQKANTSLLTTQYDWCWTANKIYVYSTVNPLAAYNQVEVSQRTVGIDLNGQEHLVLDSLNVQFVGNTGIQGNYFNKRDLVIQNCTISFVGVKGGRAAYGVQANYSDMTVQNNIIHSCGRRGFSIGNSPDNALVENVLFDHNTFYDGYHTTGIDIECNSDGILIHNITIRNNYFSDSLNKQITGAENYASELLFISEQSGESETGTGVIRDIYIHNNIFENPSSYAIGIDNDKNLYVYNNSFKCSNPNQLGYASTIGVGAVSANKLDSIFIKNNIIETTQPKVLLYIDQLTLGHLFSDYNVIYSTYGNWIMQWNNIATCYPSQTSLNNWYTSTGLDQHSVFADPLLNANFTLQTGSPAIASGINLGYGTDIGAIPYSHNPPNVNAGSDQSITLPTSSVTMAGTASGVDTTLSLTLWTQLSGPNTATITTPTLLTTTITGLIAGTYKFILTATDNFGLSASDTMQVLVNHANIPPVANAGGDQSITLPTTSLLLHGSGTGTIVGYSWSQTSGPNTATIVSPTTANTTMSSLIQGAYVFKLTVLDANGLTGNNSMTLTVNPLIPGNSLRIGHKIKFIK